MTAILRNPAIGFYGGFLKFANMNPKPLFFPLRVLCLIGLLACLSLSSARAQDNLGILAVGFNSGPFQGKGLNRGIDEFNNTFGFQLTKQMPHLSQLSGASVELSGIFGRYFYFGMVVNFRGQTVKAEYLNTRGTVNYAELNYRLGTLSLPLGVNVTGSTKRYVVLGGNFEFGSEIGRFRIRTINELKPAYAEKSSNLNGFFGAHVLLGFNTKKDIAFELQPYFLIPIFTNDFYELSQQMKINDTMEGKNTYLGLSVRMAFTSFNFD